MNLTGHWNGSFTYGNGYSDSVMGKSEPFTMDLLDTEGRITGLCIDKIVNEIPGNKAVIEGTFSDDMISFSKRYQHHLAIDEHGNYFQSDNVDSDAVHYVGHLKKKFLTGKPYFIGEWQINCVFKDNHGNISYYSCEGTWTMSST